MMSSSFVDLHTHSTASDGTDSPAVLVQKAARTGLSALALTDHDTVSGLDEAAQEAEKLGIDLLPGVEISAHYPRPGIMHLLGYGFDPHHPTLTALLIRLQAGREERNAFLLRELNAVGVQVTEGELLAVAGGRGVVGRPHFARLLTLKGYVPHPTAAFRYYLGNAGRFRFDRYEPTAREVFEVIHAAGGIVSLAHPLQLRRENHAQLAHLIKDLADQGLDAVETIYNDHRESFVAELQDLCRRYGLLPTGGSDYHGSAKKWLTLGKAGDTRRVPREWYEAIVDRLGERAAA